MTLDGLQRGGVALQCFADFVPTGMFPTFCRGILSRMMFNSYYHKYQVMMERYKDSLYPVLSAADIERAEKEEKIGVLLTIEDGGVMGRTLSNVEKYYEKGVRLVTLTWNHPNPIGFPNSKDPAVMSKGLTPYGVEVVTEMERLGEGLTVAAVSSDGIVEAVEYQENLFALGVQWHPERDSLTDLYDVDIDQDTCNVILRELVKYVQIYNSQN